MAELKLYSTGRGFYRESGTAIGLLHEVGTHRRTDWGFVEMALERGDTVTIRPANSEEMARVMDAMQQHQNEARAWAAKEFAAKTEADKKFMAENAWKP